MRFSLVLYLVINIVIQSACNDENSPNMTTDAMSAGEVSAGEINAGEMLAGDIPAGEIPAGEMNIPEELVWQFSDLSRLIITSKPFSMTLEHPHGEALKLNGNDLGFGVVDALQENKSYDPYWLHHPYLGSVPSQSDSLRWVHIAELDQEPMNLSNTDRELSLAITLSDGKQTTLDLKFSGTNSLRISLSYPNQTSAEAAFAYWEAPARENEQFYGLGESFDHVARRGTYRSLGFQIIPNTESGYNEAHVPVPLLISTQGVAYFFDTDLPSYFDVAYEEDDLIRAEQARPDPLKLHLIWSEHPSGAINEYYELTGRPLVPPYWAFAPHYWRNVTTGQNEVEADMTQMRQLGIPGGNFWIDRPYQQAYMDCIFDPNRYSDPSEMQEHFEDLGYKMILWHAPYTSEASDAYEEAESGNYFIQGILFFMNFGKIMDFTNPAVMDLWARLLDRFNQFGVAGYKLDYGEDVQVGFGGNRLRYDFFDGSNEQTMHHRYATFYHQAYLQTLTPAPMRDATELLAPNTNPHQVDGFLLGRSSTHGGQQYIHTLWPGDLDSDFRRYLEDDYWVGGLPAAVIGGLTLSVSGFPFYGSDTGGFRNNRPTQEVLIRWAWQTAFSAIMQIGGGGSSHFPWADAGDTEEVYDEQGVEMMREAARWNMRLTDYRFSYGLIARETGQPLLQPFGFAYPHDGRHPDDVYLLGPDLLVAPIINSNSQRTIPLPEGIWLDFWTSELLTGPSDIERTVELGSQALFIRTGAIIPLLHPQVQTLNSVNRERSEVETTVTIDQLSHPLTWLLAPPIDETIQEEYINHEGSRVLLSNSQVLIEPSTTTPYPAFEIDIRHDPDLELTELEVNETPITWVNETESADCLSCAWYKSTGQVHIRLNPHQNAPQLITW